MSSETRKSKTFTGCTGRESTTEGGLGAGGGGSTIAIVLLAESTSGASSTYALRGPSEVASWLGMDFRDSFDGFSL